MVLDHMLLMGQHNRAQLRFRRRRLWVGNSVTNSDVLRNSDVWSRDRPKGVARDWKIQGQRHATHMLQACGLGSSHVRENAPLPTGVPRSSKSPPPQDHHRALGIGLI